MKKAFIILAIIILSLALFVACDNSTNDNEISLQPADDAINQPVDETSPQNNSNDKLNKVICDLGDNGAYFYNQFDESSRNTTRTVEVYGNAPYHVESRLPNPFLSPIVMPDGLVFEGWYFKDGMKATDENLLNQKIEKDKSIKVFAHWTTEDRVYLRFITFVDIGYPYLFTLKFKETDPKRYPLNTRNGHRDTYISNSDYASLLQGLPTVDDIDVVDLLKVIDDSSNDYEVLDESFPVFEWRIFDSVQRQYCAITEENWQRIVSNSKTRAVELKLYYELADINDTIKLCCLPKFGRVHLTDVAKEKYGITGEYYEFVAPEMSDMVTFDVQRSCFQDIYENLPKAEDYIYEYYDENGNLHSSALSSIEWKFIVKNSGFDWGFGLGDDIVLDLTEEIFLELSKQQIGIYLKFEYTLAE